MYTHAHVNDDALHRMLILSRWMPTLSGLIKSPAVVSLRCERTG